MERAPRRRRRQAAPENGHRDCRRRVERSHPRKAESIRQELVRERRRGAVAVGRAACVGRADALGHDEEHAPPRAGGPDGRNGEGRAEAGVDALEHFVVAPSGEREPAE